MIYSATERYSPDHACILLIRKGMAAIISGTLEMLGALISMTSAADLG